MHYRFHANVYVLPDGVAAREQVHLRGVDLPVLRTADGRPPTFDASFGVTFEDAIRFLARFPRLDAEPDGFFVIAGGLGPTRWQLDGHLYDFAGKLHRLELHGDCPREDLDALLECLDWPLTPLAFELVREGVAVDEAAFRAWAGA
jgi:hypothetical protein